MLPCTGWVLNSLNSPVCCELETGSICCSLSVVNVQNHSRLHCTEYKVMRKKTSVTVLPAYVWPQYMQEYNIRGRPLEPSVREAVSCLTQ